MTALNVETRVGGRYRLERLIGRGGMAEVWLAADERLGRPVALKFLDPSLADERDFERETGILAGLRDPHIVTVYDAGQEDGRRFIVMEWVDGESLRERLQATGTLPLRDVVAIGAATASALAHAHERGILHNDVKPENILLDAREDARLTDFGVARVTGDTVAPGDATELLGTVAYVAPEVLQGAPAGPESDVYALGTTIFEAISGRLPFDAPSNAALAGQKLNAQPRPLEELVPSIPASLAAVIASSLAFSPADRPAARDFAAALKGTPWEDTVGAAAIAPSLLTTGVSRVTQPIRPMHKAAALRSREAHARRLPPPKRLLLAAVFGGAALVVVGGLALAQSDGRDDNSAGPTPFANSGAASTADGTPTPAPLSTEPAQQVAPPTTNGDDDNDDDKDEKAKPGRGRGGR